jgi:hypothetical protein
VESAGLAGTGSAELKSRDAGAGLRRRAGQRTRALPSYEEVDQRAYDVKEEDDPEPENLFVCLALADEQIDDHPDPEDGGGNAEDPDD